MRSIIKALQNADFQVNRALTWIPKVLILVTMFWIVADVTGRYLFDAPIAGTLEASELALAVIIWFSVTFFEIKTGHISITLFYSRLPTRGQIGCDILGKALAFIMFALLAWQNLGYAIRSWVIQDVPLGAVLPIPLWIPKFAIFLGCFLFSLHSLGGLLLKLMRLPYKGGGI